MRRGGEPTSGQHPRPKRREVGGTYSCAILRPPDTCLRLLRPAALFRRPVSLAHRRPGPRVFGAALVPSVWADHRRAGMAADALRRPQPPGRRTNIVNGRAELPSNHFDRSVVENQVELLTEGAEVNCL